MRPACLVWALLLLVSTTPAAAGAGSGGRSLVIERFHADLGVNPDGSLDVAETIQPRFAGAWNGIFRTIPVEYRTPQGLNFTLLLDLVDIRDETGRSLRYEQSRERHYRKIKIWIPGAADGVRTVVLRYRVRNGIKFLGEHDELYWNVTGDEWQAPIRSASARILLPQGTTGVRAIAFTGAYGSREQAAQVDLDEGGVSIRTTRPLGFREGLTVAVGWDPGFVRRPGLLEQTALFLRSNWPLGVPFGVLLLMLGLWYTRGRDPRHRPIAPQYAPPEGLSPAEVGTLVDNSPDLRDITATLVDLAVQGYLQIQEQEERKLLGLLAHKEYLFTMRKTPQDWERLKPHERMLLESLFAGGARPSVASTDLEHWFFRRLPILRDQIFAALLERRFYLQRPDRVKQLCTVAGIVLGLGLGVGGSVVGAGLGLAPLTTIIAGVLTAGIVVGFGWIMPARTVRGTRALEGVLGFEEFLTRVEGDRLRRMVKTPELFEKFLPYAMALGVEKHWAMAFEEIYRQPPEWYQGRSVGSFHPRGLVSDLSEMSSRTAAAMSSSPRSAGGSGFGGGGSSGGGLGGGGGGGF
jgi:uncharacterized membrane protein YgcG